GDLRPVGPGTALDRLADLPARGVPLGLECVALAEKRPAARIELQRSVDDGGVLALVDGTLADRFGVLAEALEPDAHPPPPTAAGAPFQAPASRSRSMTKRGSSDARSQPARGPFGRPRNAA